MIIFTCVGSMLTTAVLRPDRYFGSVPEKLISDIEQYISSSSNFRNRYVIVMLPIDNIHCVVIM